jgi:imidazolonepropionase-like amidohydrolase
MSKTAFVNGPVFVGDGQVIESGLVVMEDERITRVESAPAEAPADATVIDLGGNMLLPGMIDCHIHICYDGSNDPFKNRQGKSVADITLMSAEHARQTIMNGVTSIRDMGAPDGIDLALRSAQASGMIAAPRMKVSCGSVCMTGGHGWRTGREADGPDEVRKAAREKMKAGADHLKLMATGGVMTPGVEPGSAQYTEEEMRAGIEEAHKAGRLTATHAQGREGILNALRAGIDSIEHGFYVDEDAISLMLENNIYLVPTLAAVQNIVSHGTKAGVPEYAVKKAEKVVAIHRENLMKAFKAGVKVAMGTDAGTPFNKHGENLQELSLLVEAGFTASEALIATTSTAAEVLGMGDELGMIEPGRLADLIVCSGNPIEDIGLLTDPQNISQVFQGGKKIKG